MTEPLPQAFRHAIQNWPSDAQAAFCSLRRIVRQTAADIPGLGLIETLKWGQPSWLPDRPRTGSTLRASWSPDQADRLTLFVHCQTSLADTMRTLYPDAFKVEGTRALHIDLCKDLPTQAIAHCAEMTLTYHRKTA